MGGPRPIHAGVYVGQTRVLGARLWAEKYYLAGGLGEKCAVLKRIFKQFFLSSF